MWNLPSSIEEFRQLYDSDAASLFNQLGSLVQRYESERDIARGHVLNYSSQLDAANKSIDNLEQQIDKLKVELNVARVVQHPTPPPNPVKNFRSERFPHPEKFDGDRANLPGFLIQLQMKLMANNDRFQDEQFKIAYSISLLEGRALQQIVPIVRANPSAPFGSMSALIAYLEASFGDPDPRETARQELQNLQQGKEEFSRYYSEFLRIIGYLNYNENAKIDALDKGLSTDLKDAMVHHPKKHTNLDEYALMLMKLDRRIRGLKIERNISHSEIAPHIFPGEAQPSHVSGGLTSMY